MIRRGATMMELLVGILLVGLVLYAALQLFTAGYTTYFRSSDLNISYQRSRKVVDVIADHVRNAQMNTNGSYVVNASLHDASASSITYYTNSAGDQVQFFLNSGQLRRTLDGSTTTLMDNVTNLSFSYFRLTSYNSGWTPIAGTQATTAELPTIGLVRINATTTVNGYTSSYETFVRLRNSPRKVRLSGG